MGKYNDLAKSLPQNQKELLPEGLQLARCVRIIDYGTQHNERFQKDERKISIVFEFPEIKKVFDETKGEEPILKGQTYSFSFGEKSNLRKTLKSWLGRDVEQKDFDEDLIIGKPCMIGIEHKKNEDGTRIYDNITSIVQEMPRMPVPPQITKSLVYLIDTDKGNLEGIPEWQQEIIKKSPEYRRIVLGEKTGKTEMESLEETMPR